MQDYHQLDIWNRAMDYTAAIYQFSAQLPSDERFNLVAQVRKAAITCLELCERLQLVTPSSTAPLIDEGNQISRMIYSFIQRLGGS